MSEHEDLFRDKPKRPNKVLRITLPLPPSVNHMYHNTRNGGRRLTRQAENYIRVSRALINEAVEEQHWLKHTRATWLYLDCVFFMPDRRVRDSHNMLKLLLDVMEGNVFENDYFVMPRVQYVGLDVKNPRVEVLLTIQTPNQVDKGLKMCGLLN